MNSWAWLKDLVGGRKSSLNISALDEGYAPPSRDTLAAIEELSRVVKNNPDAVEIYLALGNLYRSQGEVERAVQIRRNLVVRPDLSPEFKAKAYYEMGRDFQRAGFMDRSKESLEKALHFSGDDPRIIHELASLESKTGNYLRAAELYSKLGHTTAVAHYLVRQAQEKLAAGETGAAKKLLKKALHVYPGSVEAWLEQLILALKSKSKTKLNKTFSEALTEVSPDLRFLLMELLMQILENSEGSFIEKFEKDLCSPEEVDEILAIISSVPQDVLLHYYGAQLLLLSGERSEAQVWFEKTLVLNPEFWPARLQLLALSMEEQALSPAFRNQLDFFVARAHKVKRFVCKVCGLKREQTFFVCPRCQSWHSISFRMNLTE